jgi:hypothetical protein
MRDGVFMSNRVRQSACALNEGFARSNKAAGGAAPSVKQTKGRVSIAAALSKINAFLTMAYIDLSSPQACSSRVAARQPASARLPPSPPPA